MISVLLLGYWSDEATVEQQKISDVASCDYRVKWNPSRSYARYILKIHLQPRLRASFVSYLCVAIGNIFALLFWEFVQDKIYNGCVGLLKQLASLMPSQELLSLRYP